MTWTKSLKDTNSQSSLGETDIALDPLETSAGAWKLPTKEPPARRVSPVSFPTRLGRGDASFTQPISYSWRGREAGQLILNGELPWGALFSRATGPPHALTPKENAIRADPPDLWGRRRHSISRNWIQAHLPPEGASVPRVSPQLAPSLAAACRPWPPGL